MVSNSVGSGRTWLQNTLWFLHVSLFLLKLFFLPVYWPAPRKKPVPTILKLRVFCVPSLKYLTHANLVLQLVIELGLVHKLGFPPSRLAHKYGMVSSSMTQEIGSCFCFPVKITEHKGVILPAYFWALLHSQRANWLPFLQLGSSETLICGCCLVQNLGVRLLCLWVGRASLGEAVRVTCTIKSNHTRGSNRISYV